MKTETSIYLIQCITNLHAGSGDANYGVVDKLVQRDSVTNFPTIHSSSLKGGLREHFEKAWCKPDIRVNHIFGKEDTDDGQNGAYSFLGADLAALPVRLNYQQFALAISPKLLDLQNQKSILLTSKTIYKPITDETQSFLYINNNPGYTIYAESTQLQLSAYQYPFNFSSPSGFNAFSDRFASFTDSEFEAIVKGLPVIARNKIENGTSNNLWYEEVVPHQTLFVTYIVHDDKYFTEFETELLNAVVQIGGNASIGYGLCKFYKIDIA